MSRRSLASTGSQAQFDAARAVLAELDGLEPVDVVDRVTLAAMRERIGLELELHDADEWIGALNNLASPLQALRDIFDIMATSTPQHWENIAARLNALPEAADGFIASLRLAASRGRVAPALQVRECITQAEELAGPDSFFTTLVTGAEVDAALDDSAPCAAIRTSLADGAGADLEETYTWGLAELARVVAEQEAVAAQIAGPGATVEQAITVLDAEPG